MSNIYFIKNEQGQVIFKTTIETEFEKVYNNMITEGKKVIKETKKYITDECACTDDLIQE